MQWTLIRLFFLGLACISGVKLYSQSIELIGGINQNYFYDKEPQGGYFNSSYTSEIGYKTQIAIEGIKIDWLKLRFNIGYEKYGGQLEAVSGSSGGYQRIVADVEKSILSLGVFPVNFKIWKRIDLNAGIELGRLLKEE